MPAYNTENYIGAAISSILNETFQDFELLILDDASTDKTFEIAESFSKKDSRVKVFRNNKNSGKVVKNHVKLATLAKGEFLLPSDSDDVSLSHRMRVLVDAAEKNPNAAMVYGVVNSVSEDLKKDTYKLFGVNREMDVIPNFICPSNYDVSPNEEFRKQIAPKGQPIITHVSNFRPVKRIIDVVEIYALVLEEIDARLLLVGDGPERCAARDTTV